MTNETIDTKFLEVQRSFLEKKIKAVNNKSDMDDIMLVLEQMKEELGEESKRKGGGPIKFCPECSSAFCRHLNTISGDRLWGDDYIWRNYRCMVCDTVFAERDKKYKE